MRDQNIGDMMLRAIIFDLDGVVAESHPAHKQAWGELLISLGRTVSPQELDYVVEGRKRDEILRHFLGQLDEQQIRDYGMKKDCLFSRHSAHLKPVPGVCEFIQQVQDAGLGIALASSAGRKRVESNLRQLGLFHYFKILITGDDVVRGKPDPALFNIAAHKLNVSACETLVCEDAVNGVQAAKTAGMKCLAIASPGRAEVLKATGADKVAPDFTNVSLHELRLLFAAPGASYAAGAESLHH